MNYDFELELPGKLLEYMSSFLVKLRNRFFSPDSDLELKIRTLYHRLNSSKLAFYIKDHKSRYSYLRNRRRATSEKSIIIPGPKITFLLSVTPDEEKQSIKTIQSVLQFLNEETQLFLIVTDEPLRSRLALLIKNNEHLIVQNEKYTELTDLPGEYLVFCQPGDIFFPALVTSFYGFHEEYPARNVYYYDCEYINKTKKSAVPLCKPSMVSMDTLLSVNLFSRGFFRRDFITSKLSDEISGNFGAFEYDLSLIAVQTPESIGHIPEVLVQQQSLMQPVRQEVLEVIKNHLETTGVRDVSFNRMFNQPHFSWAIRNKHVAIIIPTKNHSRLLRPLLSTLESTEYKNFSIILVDNATTDPETLEFYERLDTRQDIRIIPFNKPFNYSEAINVGVSGSDSDLLLFLNDDMLVIDDEWLGELVQWAQRPEIGVVGTKLLRKNRTIQHAGIVVGMNDFIGHLYLNAPKDYTGLFGPVDWYRNFTAITGACQMVRRSVFEEAQGYDEDFQLAFGDVDFCIRVQSLGYRNVYTPFAYLYHLEGMSRGYATPINDIRLGYANMKSYLLAPDPNYSERLSLSVIPKYIGKVISSEERKKSFEERQKFYQK